MTLRSYSTPLAFKQSLEQRLRSDSGPGPALARRRQLLIFDRFLARVVHTLGDAATLKGGLVLELRLSRARTTRDIDLRLTGSSARVLERLQQAARLDLDDWLSFEVGRDDEHPDIQSDAMQYEGMRFRVECRLAGKLYGQRFGVDVAFGDPIVGEPERVTPRDLLGFVGVPPPTLRPYPVETHIAEKLHAYTMPRSGPNSRVKDLPDIALLATTGQLRAERLAEALKQTFSFRKTHALPTTLPAPISSWQAPYEAMARADTLRWPTLAELTTAASSFLDPILAGERQARWQPEDWRWRDWQPRAALPGPGRT